MPKLIAMSGFQGSGKSTIAYKLSEKLNIPVYSVDPIHSAILKAGVEDSEKIGYADYLVAERLADENLKNGISAIIDASNYIRAGQEIWEKLAAKHNIALMVIECKVNVNIHKERIKNRTRNLYGMNEITWEDVQKRIDESEEWVIEKLVLDTSEDIETNVKKVVEYIIGSNLPIG